jgi:hypothetical protein
MGVAQCPQNFAMGRFTTPQTSHGAPSSEPQLVQNLKPSSLSARHAKQRIFLA